MIDDLEETDGNFCDAPQSRWEGIIVDDDEGADAEEEEDDESDGIELRYHTARVTGVQLLADGDLLSSSLDASIVEWNAVTRARARRAAFCLFVWCCPRYDRDARQPTLERERERERRREREREREKRRKD